LILYFPSIRLILGLGYRWLAISITMGDYQFLFDSETLLFLRGLLLGAVKIGCFGNLFRLMGPGHWGE
jgi:hypothetical protein